MNESFRGRNRKERKMTFTSLVLQKLLATNAHLGRSVASRHSEVYVYGFRNEVAILDSDKTLVCLRNALHFLGSLFRENGRVLIVNTNSLFDEITEQTAAKLGKNCLNDAQLMNLLSSSTKRKIRLSNTRKAGGRSIIGGVPALRPDCVVAMNAERESSAIIEAARNKIPVVSLIESDISLGLYKRITYPVPANDSIQFVYLFCNLIAKTWNHTRNRNLSRSPEQMCYQESQMYLSPEEAAAAEESLATYCKPVEFYNILQRRALRHPLFLQRCLHYKIQAKRRRRIKMTITFSGFVRNEVQEQHVFPLYVLVSSPISDSPGDSAVYRSGRTCLLKASTQLGCNEQSAVSFILSEIGKLSEDVVTDNLTILFVYCVDHRNLHGEKNLQICSLVNYSGEVLWGKLAMGSLCNSWESSVSLKLGHKANVMSSVDLHSSILEHTCKENGVDHLIFKAPSNSDDLNSLMRLQVDISAQELGPRESSPYDSYSYSDIPSSLLSRIIRMRAGNVIFNYKYYNNKLRKTEVTEDFTCPFCLVRCSSFQGLRHHLTCSHDLFNFAFWVNEEFQTVDVSLKTEIWRYEGNIADEDGNVLPYKPFSYCSRSCSVKRRRTAVRVRDSAYSHHQVKQDSLGTGSFGQSQNALIKIAPANSHEASVGPFINGTISSKEPSSARIVYNQSPGGTLSEIQNSTELEQGSHLAPSSPAREDRPQLNDALRVESKEDTEKQGILGNGEIALPSQRHEIENAYMEQACAGDSMLAGIQVSVADSGEYGPQTDASNLIPPSTLRFGKTRKLSVEGGEPRSRILLKKRQFFHSHRAQPMALEQVFSDRDSEDEVDDDIADFEDRRMLDDFVDVTKYEKQLMHLWNSFVRKQRVLADGHVPWACEAFSKHHGQDLARFPPLRWCWRLFMVKLWNHNLLDAGIMNRCNNIIDDFGKNQ